MDPSPPPPLAIAPAPPAFRKSGLLFFGVLLLLLQPSMLAQALDRAVGLAWTELFGILLPAVAAAAGSNLRVRRYLGLGGPPPAAVGVGVAMGVAGFLMAQSLELAWQRFLPARWLESWNTARLFEVPPLVQAAVLLSAAVLAPLCEEIAFRGYLLRTLAIRRGPALAVAGSALLFALLHMNPVLFPGLLALGITFGWLAWRTGSTWSSIAAHATNNGIASALALLAPRGDGEPVQAAPWSFTLGALAAGAALVLATVAAARRRFPPPPPALEAVALRDPLDPDLRFRFRRLPPAVLLGFALATASLALLLFRVALQAPPMR